MYRTPITKQQRQALKNIFDRLPLISRYIYPDRLDQAYFVNRPPSTIDGDLLATWYPVTYRGFRKSAFGPLGSDGYLAVPWCGMWLCIEPDGYIHS